MSGFKLFSLKFLTVLYHEKIRPAFKPTLKAVNFWGVGCQVIVGFFSVKENFKEFNNKQKKHAQ